jgi:hypothetical protein
LRIEMTIVEAGARRDLGQGPEASRLLQRAVQNQPPTAALRGPVARLRYAYAEVLLESGDEAEARRWFAAAAKLDTDGELDAQERVDALDGLLIEFDEEEDEPGLEPEEAQQIRSADGDDDGRRRSDPSA